ncbi:hypothetical protein LCY76_16560 [Fictibacillus sp. KIGAM418]|uniref:Uncharacterized protein n=1 Tax=Fictibacillus marinisediminis TaxID=2878389 RepID=A0A9X1XEQ5_9BACL|nr:hypothetical protein [Fictibacillus marinisediminis]MCK6258188.1 hypothetical protein [Fictibacillus marinisediminis]
MKKSAELYPKKINIYTIIVTAVVLHLVLFLFHSLQPTDFIISIGLIWGVIEHNKAVGNLKG